MFSSSVSSRKLAAVWRMSSAIILTTILLAALAHQLLAHAQSAIPQSIILKIFSAQCLIGQPEIYIEWETVREPDTVGFFVSRSLTATLGYTHASDFIPHEGNNVTGAVYAWMDDTTEISRTYYYRLETINTDMTSDYYGPLSVTAGIDCHSTLFIPRIYLPLIIRTS